MFRRFIRFNSIRPRHSKVYAPLRRVNEKRTPPNLNIVTALTVSEEINLSQVIHSLNFQSTVLVPDEVLNYNIDNEKDIMVLANGTLVGWGLDEEYLLNFLPKIKSAIREKYQYESEEMDFRYINSSSTESNDDDHENSSHKNGNLFRKKINGEVINSNQNSKFEEESHMEGEILVLRNDNSKKLMLEKAAFAVGFSRSTRLAVLETSLENHIRLTRENSVNLSLGRKIQTKEKDLLQWTGKLFLLRGKLNLYSELIETPDLYWSEPTLEKIYQAISKTLDISPRIAILNRKLDYATEEQRALLSVLNEKKSTRLEWIIIILIMVEVCFETFHFYERYETKKTEESN